MVLGEKSDDVRLGRWDVMRVQCSGDLRVESSCVYAGSALLECWNVGMLECWNVGMAGKFDGGTLRYEDRQSMKAKCEDTLIHGTVQSREIQKYLQSIYTL